MNWARSLKFLLLILSMGYLSSCQEDDKPVSVVVELTIASDYLEEDDTILFNGFSKKNNVRIQIVQMNADRMIGHFRNRKYDNGIDIIMLRSLYDVNRLSRNKLFHSIDQIIAPADSHSTFNSDKYDYVGIGINPYVLTYDKGSSSFLKTYNEQRENAYYSNLQKAELVPFFSGIMPTHHKVGTYEWIKDFKLQKRESPSYDSTGNNTCLTLYDAHFSLLDDTTYNKHYNTVYFPNQHGKGMFYDLRTITVVNQAEHFTTAKEFVSYYLQAKNNAVLCKSMNVLPLSDNEKVRLNRVSSEELIQYYVLVERMLTKQRFTD